ncbi:MAG TPA: hypothetical protein VNO70_17125, partial [Blastocatellia bacterium]|nr:hypothetical protein [Blastocatellia bacterium]
DSLTSDMVTFRDSMLDLKDVALSLTHIVERQDEQIEENSKQIAALIERGKETDARLNTLITVVERHISGHR